MTNKKTNHHHGDLREALIRAGVELLDEGGVAALTLRKCAARAGVSHAAPAHHFQGILSLYVAIIARGHQIFAGYMAKSRASAGPEPMAQLLACCVGYLEFAQAHNALFHFMFHHQRPDISGVSPWVMDELNKQASISYGHLQQACAPFEADPIAPNSTEVMVWSMVHGYAMLFGDVCEAETPTGPLPDFEVLLSGLGLRLHEYSGADNI